MPTKTIREFLAVTATALAAAVAGGVSPRSDLTAAQTRNAQRPNVLLLMCDQLTASVLSCYGGPVPTPNIDRIAREGVRFNQAVCPTPFCSPTRGSIVTGMYPHAHGIVANCGTGRRGAQEGVHAGDVTTEKLLHAAGYATHHYGKWHLFGEKPPYYPDMYDVAEYEQEMAATFAKTAAGPAEFMPWYSWTLPVEIAPTFRAAVDRLGDRWSKQRYAPFITKMGRLKLPVEQHFDVRVADHAVERLKNLSQNMLGAGLPTPPEPPTEGLPQRSGIGSKSLQGRPFMVTCSFIAPHDPNVVPSPYYEAFQPSQIELPANRGVREGRFEKDWSREVIAGLGEPGLREFLRVYYGMVALIDDQVGRILKVLESAGQLDKTLLVFTADHGDMAGGHGMVWKSTSAFYDEIARVPLLIRYPKRLRPQQNEMAVDLTDLMPTLLELAGLPIPEQVQGQSLAPYLTGERDPGQARHFAFSERVSAHPEGSRKLAPNAGGSFMIRGEGWKYIRYRDGGEYLYNLAGDPGETKNLAEDPACRSRRDELAAAIDAWLRRTGWPGDRLTP